MPSAKDNAAERIGGSDIDGLLVSQCVYCKHKHKDTMGCDAYPSSIPMRILRNQHDHRLPYAGDNGVRFERK